jgi:bacterioferritin
MKGNAKVLAALGEALKNEITAINQYFVHSEMCENWGYVKLHKAVKGHSIDEMKHAEKLIERILFLEGTPIMESMAGVSIGSTVPEQLKKDLTLEQGAVKSYNAAIKVCAEAGDNVSRDLFLTLLKDEEGHVDWLEMQIDLISQLSLAQYLSTQV